MFSDSNLTISATIIKVVVGLRTTGLHVSKTQIGSNLRKSRPPSLAQNPLILEPLANLTDK